MQSHLLGTIELTNPMLKKSIKTYSVNSNFRNISMTDTFMNNFKKMGFTEDEKQNLTQENRYELIHYQSLTLEDVKDFVSQFISRINSSDCEAICINATGFGAYVCLAAIMSEKLPRNKRYQINLEGIPIKLFPKKLVTTHKATHNVEISYTIQEKCWFNDFNSLTTAPAHLSNIKQLIDLRLNRKRSAA
jgi:hypothetical protein